MSITLKRSICSHVSSLYDLVHKEQWKSLGLRILIYHSIGKTLTNDRYGMTISINSFRDQINMLSEDSNFEIISLNSKNTDSLWNPKSTKLNIAITFDDGYRDNLRNAAPLLMERGVPFTVFVTEGYLQKNNNIYLNENELKELSGLTGVAIGSHGMTHSRLTRLNDRDLVNELSKSRWGIENIIGEKVEMLSYPHGKFDRRVVNVALQSGYRLGAGSRFGINSPDTNPMYLKRTEIWSTDSMDVFRQKCSGAWDWYAYWQRARGM